MAAVRGDKALLATMRIMKAETYRSLDPIAKEALEPTRVTAKRLAATRRQFGTNPPGGHLDEGVVTAKISGRQALRVFWVSLRGRARKIGHLVEFGTAPHFQPRRNRMHPGARAFPFMTMAFDATKGTVVKIVSSGLWRVIQATALRYGRRG